MDNNEEILECDICHQDFVRDEFTYFERIDKYVCRECVSRNRGYYNRVAELTNEG